jgi:hypothetical protein
MVALDESRAVWRKSSRSGQNGNCVEVAPIGAVVGVRDSKDPGGPHLAVNADQWTAFLHLAKLGAFDRG